MLHGTFPDEGPAIHADNRRTGPDVKRFGDVLRAFHGDDPLLTRVETQAVTSAEDFVQGLLGVVDGIAGHE